MSTDRDTTRIVRSWLEEGVTALPDRVLDAVLDQVPATPQRRSWWPTRRFAQMNNAKLAMAVAALVVVAVVGYNLLTARGGIGGPAASPSPTVVPSPAPVPSGSMAPGTYVVTDPGITLHPWIFTLPTSAPTGWTGGDGASRGDMAGTGVHLTSWIITHVYTDSCQWTGKLIPVANKASLIAAFTAQLGHTHSTPVETTIGGLPATKIVFSLDPAFDMGTCDEAIVRLWPDPGPDENGGWFINPGHTTTVYIVEANGRLMVLLTVVHKDSPPADIAALQQVLDSVRFLP